MGAARSSNSASAITNVSNMISNSTSANVDQASYIANRVNLDHCDINLSGDFTVNTMANVQQSNNQYIKAKQSAKLNNNLSQIVQQTATSTVGALGVGYAQANNSVSATVNSTNQIINNMNAVAASNSSITNEFQCNRSTIRAKNMTLDFNSKVNFITDQVVNNTQNTEIENVITQSITQTATATVEGFGSIILALMLLAAVILYGGGKVIDNPASAIAINIGLVIGIVAIVTFQYLRSTPPFFAKPMNCVNNSALGRGTGGNIPECIEMTEQPLELNSPPQKYTYPILPGGLPTSVAGNLLQMSIAANSGQTVNGAGSNGGYRVDIYNILKSRIKKYNTQATALKIPNIPNPLYVPRPVSSSGGTVDPYYAIPEQYLQAASVSGSQLAACTPGIIEVGTSSSASSLDNCPSIAIPSLFSTTSDQTKAVANLNLTDWNDYINLTNESKSGLYTPAISGYSGSDEQQVRSLFARFVLCDLIGNIDLNHWVYPKEYVKYMDENNNQVIMLASQASTDQKYSNQIYKYKPYGTNTNYVNGFTGPGTTTGYIGVIDNKQYRLQKFSRAYGIYIFFGLTGIFFLYSVFNFFNSKKESAVNSVSESDKLPQVKPMP